MNGSPLYGKDFQHGQRFDGQPPTLADAGGLVIINECPIALCWSVYRRLGHVEAEPAIKAV